MKIDFFTFFIRCSKTLILGFLFCFLYSSGFGQPIQIVGPIEVCEGNTLEITVKNLPTTGTDDDVFIQFQNNTTSTILSVTENTSFMLTHTFTISGFNPAFSNDGDMIKINFANQDPNGTPLALGVDQTLQNLTVYEAPTGTISGGTPATICANGDYMVTFNANPSTAGPYDLMIGTGTITGVTSGGTVTLVEGTHFTGSGQITLTQIINRDAAVPTNFQCPNTIK